MKDEDIVCHFCQRNMLGKFGVPVYEYPMEPSKNEPVSSWLSCISCLQDLMMIDGDEN